MSDDNNTPALPTEPSESVLQYFKNHFGEDALPAKITYETLLHFAQQPGEDEENLHNAETALAQLVVLHNRYKILPHHEVSAVAESITARGEHDGPAFSTEWPKNRGCAPIAVTAAAAIAVTFALKPSSSSHVDRIGETPAEQQTAPRTALDRATKPANGEITR